MVNHFRISARCDPLSHEFFKYLLLQIPLPSRPIPFIPSHPSLRRNSHHSPSKTSQCTSHPSCLRFSSQPLQPPKTSPASHYAVSNAATPTSATPLAIQPIRRVCVKIRLSFWTCITVRLLRVRGMMLLVCLSFRTIVGNGMGDEEG